jgi:glycerophosphoryl diester phosphodiesterase
MADALALGLKVIPWTVNEVADAERLIEMGVDGVITDYPDRMIALAKRKGLTLK